MLVAALSLRDFRGYLDARVELGEGVTVVHGPNGAGKTNLLEGLYFGCTGRSCRTANEREVIRFGASATRVTVSCRGEDGPHELAVGFAPGQPKRMRFDGAPVERLLDVAGRPLISVFLPDRLELIKGPPALRRAHLDQVVAALWPVRAATRRAYAQTLGQRNALLGRMRAHPATRDSLASWDLQLARHALALMEDRQRAIDGLREPFGRLAALLGLDGAPTLSYRPRSRAGSPEELARELAERLAGDLERGFTGHGPHRDDVVLLREERDLRAYGSQGQQRLALLALLLAEREAIGSTRTAAPLMLLDDVMSELDRDRRQALVELLRAGEAQSIITTTDLDHVPGAHEDGVTRLRVRSHDVVAEAVV
jgi:DNA replication and repair protein RecF